MGLSAKEKAALEALQRKAEEPDAPPAQRIINVSVDLGDPEQIKRGMSLGLLSSADLGDGSDGDGDGDGDGKGGDGDGDEPPTRRGYFKDK